MSTDGTPAWPLLIRAAINGLVLGFVVGTGASVVFELVNEPDFSMETVLIGSLAGLVFGLVTSLILALVVIVFGDKVGASLRVIVTLLTIFIVGGLGGLLGLNAPELAFFFGVPAAVGVWIVYPRVLADTGTTEVPRLDRSNKT